MKNTDRDDDNCKKISSPFTVLAADFTIFFRSDSMFLFALFFTQRNRISIQMHSIHLQKWTIEKHFTT